MKHLDILNEIVVSCLIYNSNMALKRKNIQHNDIFNKDDMKDAYRKLKSHYYNDSQNLFMRRKIAEFECNKIDEKLDSLLKLLNQYCKKPNVLKKFLNEISYYMQPKGFENNIVDADKNNLIITNRHISEYYNLKGYNFFIDMPIELHISFTLFILCVGSFAMIFFVSLIIF